MYNFSSVLAKSDGFIPDIRINNAPTERVTDFNYGVSKLTNTWQPHSNPIMGKPYIFIALFTPFFKLNLSWS